MKVELDYTATGYGIYDNNDEVIKRVSGHEIIEIMQLFFSKTEFEKFADHTIGSFNISESKLQKLISHKLRIDV